jgi:hypothetical protein
MMSKKRIYIKPPRLSEKILSLIFPDHGSLSTIGDLEELFDGRLKQFEQRRAKLLLMKILLVGDCYALENY